MIVEKLTRPALVLGVAILGLTGCLVPESRYDQAMHRLQAEQAAHRDTAEALYQERQKLAFSKGALEEKHSALEEHELAVAQLELDKDNASVERDGAIRTVDQLRGELARAGDHLRAFSEQKHQLQVALNDAEANAQRLSSLRDDAGTRARMARDLAIVLYDAMKDGRAVVAVVEDRPVVRLDAAKAFGDDHMSLDPETAAMIEQVGAAVGGVERCRVELTERPAESQWLPENLIVRLQKVSDTLAEAGLPFERVTLTLPPEGAQVEQRPPDAPPLRWQEGPGSIELTFDLASRTPAPDAS